MPNDLELKTPPSEIEQEIIKLFESLKNLKEIDNEDSAKMPIYIKRKRLLFNRYLTMIERETLADFPILFDKKAENLKWIDVRKYACEMIISKIKCQQELLKTTPLGIKLSHSWLYLFRATNFYLEDRYNRCISILNMLKITSVSANRESGNI